LVHRLPNEQTQKAMKWRTFPKLLSGNGIDALGFLQRGIRLIDGITPPIEIPTPDQMKKLLKLAEGFGIKIIAPPEAPPASNQTR
jgi:hypothetical protein